MSKSKSKGKKISVTKFEDDEADDQFEPIPDELSLMPVSSDDHLYLAEDADTTPVVLTLAPPDFERCQCEWPDHSEHTFGPKPITRCDEMPTVIAFQKRAQGDKAPTGMISLCDEHRVMIEHMFPDQCYFRHITQEKKIGALI